MRAQATGFQVGALRLAICPADDQSSSRHAAKAVTCGRHPGAGNRPVESASLTHSAAGDDAMYADEFSIYAGNANRPLAERICRYLQTDIGAVEVFQFANENIFVRVMENVREQDVFLVQPTSRPVNQSIMELLIMIDAFKRASAGRITAVIPYYSYGRSDKKDQPRVPITARLIADMLTVAGADRVLTMDLHQGQIQGFFSIPVDELTAVNLICAHIKAKQLDDIVVVSELGFAKKARNFAELLSAPLAIVEKRRLGNEDRTEVLNIIGEVRGKTAIIIDDEIDTAGSLMEAIVALEQAGTNAIYSCATHGVFSGAALDRIAASSLTEIIVTDTIPLPPGADDPRITVLSVAPLFGEAIKRIHRGESVGALFSSEVQMVEEMTFWHEETEEERLDRPEPFRVTAG
jgi:ribose-phosphate pyrophosphokinase